MLQLLAFIAVLLASLASPASAKVGDRHASAVAVVVASGVAGTKPGGVAMTGDGSDLAHVWSDDEIARAKSACAAALKGIDVKFADAPAVRRGQCGAAAPIRVHAVAGVALKPSPLLTCQMASALATWVSETLQPAIGEAFKTRVTALRNGPGYDCRGTNRVAGAKLSQHAYANALDIMAFVTADGKTITVSDGWGGGGTSSVAKASKTVAVAPASPALDATAAAAFLKRAHTEACPIFGTVLGPDANASHHDHFHVDLATRRSKHICE